MREIYALRYGELEDVVDGVVYATCEADIRMTVSAAARSNVLLIPYGGGTSVTGALEIPEEKHLEVLDSMAGGAGPDGQVRRGTRRGKNFVLRPLLGLTLFRACPHSREEVGHVDSGAEWSSRSI